MSFTLSDRVVRLIFLLLGIGNLAPWNAFISAKPYFESRFCSGADGDDESGVEVLFSQVYNISAVVSLGIIIFWGWFKETLHRLRRSFSKKRRQSSKINLLDRDSVMKREGNDGHSFYLVMIPLGIYLLVFVGTAIMVGIPDIPVVTFQRITLVCIAACGVCQGLMSAGIVAAAGFFPSHLAINPFLSGQAVCGVAVTIANFFSAYVFHPPQVFWDEQCLGEEEEEVTKSTCVPYSKFDVASFVYFSLGALVLLLCLGGFYIVHEYPRSEEGGSTREGYETIGYSEEEEDDDDNVDDDDIDADLLLLTATSSDSSRGNLSNIVKGPAFCIFLTFVVTLTLFPAWTSELRSVHRCALRSSRLSNDLFVPWTFVLYNVGDLIGRMTAEKIQVKNIPNLPRKLVLSGFVRGLVFFPLFLICVGGTHGIKRFVIASDLYSNLIQILFGVTNGLLVCLAFMIAPSLIVDEVEIQERSSEILTFAVNFGLLGGSLLAMPFSSYTSQF